MNRITLCAMLALTLAACETRLDAGANEGGGGTSTGSVPGSSTGADARSTGAGGDAGSIGAGGEAGSSGAGGEASSSSTGEAGAGGSSSTGTVCDAAETCRDPADEGCDGVECGLWSHVYGDASGDQRPYAVVIGADGGVLLSGDVGFGGLVFGGERIDPEANRRRFVASLSPAGEERWIKLLPSQEGVGEYDIVASDDGGVILSAPFGVAFTLDGVEVENDGSSDWFLAALDADGELTWVRAFTAPGFATMEVEGLAVAPSGDLVVMAAAAPGALYDGEPLSAPGAGVQRRHMLTIDTATGDLLANKRFAGIPDTPFFYFVDPAFDADGTIVLAGAYGEPVDLGGGELPCEEFGYETFVARFDPDGTHLSSGRFCYPVCDVDDVAVGPDGAVYVAGGGEDTFLGEDTISGFQSFIARVEPNAEVAWHHVIELRSEFTLRTPVQIDVTAEGEVGFALVAIDEVDLGFAVVTLVGERDLVVGKLGVEGEPTWHRSFGAPGGTFILAPRAIAVNPAGGSIVAVNLGESLVHVGTEALTPIGGGDVAVVQLAP